jgi:formylmethanofuran dehydrogenase subunit B
LRLVWNDLDFDRCVIQVEERKTPEAELQDAYLKCLKENNLPETEYELLKAEMNSEKTM